MSFWKFFSDHFGNVPTGCTGPDDKSLVKAIPGPVLAGDFTHADGSSYVMLVNKDFTNSIVSSASESVSFLFF